MIAKYTDHKLREMIEALEHTPLKSDKETRRFIDCVRAYLDGKFATIDEAFGLPVVKPEKRRRE
jgi:hypothetical protein